MTIALQTFTSTTVASPVQTLPKIDACVRVHHILYPEFKFH